MPAGSSPKRERQYEHIKASGKNRGMSTGRAEEMASRTVNKQRASQGETGSGGKRSNQGSRSQGRTKQQLYDEAKKRDIQGRSTMTKAELERALSR
jgi:hypothetical protein